MRQATIVIAGYNAAAFLGEALDSVKNQQRPAGEIVVVDDGSSDDTFALAQRWFQSHPEVPGKLVRNARNRGLSYSRNRAIGLATCDYIATLDADDLMVPHHLARLLEPLDDDESIVLSFGDASEFDETGPRPKTILERGGDRLRRLPTEKRPNYQVIGAGLFESLVPANFVSNGGTAFRRETAIAMGLFEVSLRRSEDRDFACRMALEGKFAFVPEVVFKRRWHSSNMSGSGHGLVLAQGALLALQRARTLATNVGSEAVRIANEEMAKTARELLYSASISGPEALARASRQLQEAGFSGLARSPRAWARAYWYRWRHERLARAQPSASKPAAG